ncbi:MFS transporter [Streptomyces sp. C10-9-1]|uniref:MFS transporter n=1 Tax=Streptomyces sp. C10-9-1 TaxID=1859285 RepID=UPI003D756DBE
MSKKTDTDTDALRDPAGRRVLSAAMFASAPAEVLDFLLPLWAGSTLKAGASVVGALVAVEAVLSLLVRPLAGELSDRFEQRRVAAAGAGLYALSFAGYALADSVPLAFVASAVGGAGGALFWVGLRAWTGQRSGNHTNAYGRLLSAEGQGAFVGYLVAFSLLERSGYRPLFWLGCAACAYATVALLQGTGCGGTGTVARTARTRGPQGRALPRRLLPLMVVSAVTAAAEAGLWMLLLLRLQGDLELTPNEIAMVFAPGFVVFILLPEHTHHLTDRLGRVPTMVLSFAASTLFAAGLAVAATPVAIAVLWAVAAACFAAQIPVEQATVAAAADGQVGRGMGLYESARLAGVVAGPALMGVLYEELGWAAACLSAACVSLLGALVVPYAIRVLRLPKRSGSRADEPDRDQTTATGREHNPPHEEGENQLMNMEKPDSGMAPPASGERRLTAQEHARKERRDWLIHTAAFLVGQVILWALDSNWIVWQITNDTVPDENRGPLVWIGRIWLTIWIIDTIWSWSYTIWPREKKSK